MPRPFLAVPSYRLHKKSGQAVVTLSSPGKRKDVLLGKYKSPESIAEYNRIIAEREQVLEETRDETVSRRRFALTVNEVLARYWQHAKETYRRPDGTPTSEVLNIQLALQVVRDLFGHSAAADFDSLALKAVRDRMMKPFERETKSGRKFTTTLSRKVINQRVNQIKRAWKWIASEKLVPVTSWQSLLTVDGLREGRTPAKEYESVKPAVRSDVEKAIAVMTESPGPAAVVRLQILTGARCGELLVMKAADVDRSGPVWTFVPSRHKGSHRGKHRAIYFGRDAQDVLAEYLIKAGDGYVFSPQRTASARYTTNAIRLAILRACDRAGVPRFSPHRLRHLAAHTIRKQFGLEYCRAVLGHSVAGMTEVYSREGDRELAAEVAMKIG
jgi:integrase